MKPAAQVMLERWDEVDHLFSQALDLHPTKRLTFLETSCGKDTELFETLNTLLQSSERADGHLPGPSEGLLAAAFATPDQVAEPVPVSEPGDQVGPYRILRELGRGGTATVYEAERSDGAFEKRVAIKMLRGFASDDVVRRLVDERQILSSLSHPNIARLLDGGTTSEGRPFLVMELVYGEPITGWADAHELSIQERLDLFLQVARAVHYAHSHLIIHRDIKPSNVLVARDDGAVRLLDFGIAKLLETQAVASPETQPVTRWMTPEYASPEQILGRPVTTATDVHALGVLLYELLAGTRPFIPGDSSAFEVSRAICNDVPTLVSIRAAQTSAAATRATTPEKLCRTLSGDLDAIVAKALRKVSSDRYPSAQALVDDLERHQTGFPVLAREGMWAYRARKFVGRHRVWVTAAAGLALTLTGSVAALSLEQSRTARERDRANAAAEEAALEAENAQLVINFLADVFRGRNPNQAPSDTLTARELLDWGTDRVETEFAERPEIQSELYSVLGGAHYNMGLLDEGAALFERSLDAMRTLHGRESREVVDVLMQLAGTHQQNRDPQLAIPFMEEALEIQTGLSGPDDLRVGGILVSLSQVTRDVGLADSAEVLLREAARVGSLSEDGEILLIQAELGMAYVLRAQNRLGEAADLYEVALPRARSLQDSVDLDLPTHINNLAFLYRTRGDFERAEPLYREALAAQGENFGRGHPGTMQVANNLAATLKEMGRVDEMLDILAESAQAAEAQWPDGHWRVGSAHAGMGRALMQVGKAEDAKEHLRAAVRSFTEQLGADHDWTHFASVTYFAADLMVNDSMDSRSEARARLDSFYDELRGTYENNGSVLRNDLAQQVAPLVRVLEAGGLARDAERFRRMLPAG